MHHFNQEKAMAIVIDLIRYCHAYFEGDAFVFDGKHYAIWNNNSSIPEKTNYAALIQFIGPDACVKAIDLARLNQI